MKHISKSLLRSDADYFILAEARDGIALDTALKLASKGTKRMKITFHSRDPMEFCFDVAGEITKSLGGNPEPVVKKAASSFDYVFHFVQLKNKNQKRLKSIYELSLTEKREVSMTAICRYRHESDDWEWNYHIGTDKKLYGEEECPEGFLGFSEELASLAELRQFAR